MDPPISDTDSQATQQATQNALDPRRIGKQNSGFSDEDISDIVCLLYPLTDCANREVQLIASSPESSHFTVGRYSADVIEADLDREDDAQNFGRGQGVGDHAIVLRLSCGVKNPQLGFTFGRNKSRCDICFALDPQRRLSNIHFRIYVNEHGCVLLQDQSTNGTVVDGKLLRKKGGGQTQRMLESGSTFKIIMHQTASDLEFLVRIPRREGWLEDAYLANVDALQHRLYGDEEVEDPDKTIGPGPSGHVRGESPAPPSIYHTAYSHQVNLFPPPRRKSLPTRAPTSSNQSSSLSMSKPGRRPQQWRGGERYARVGTIGKGAFAVVHKVTSKYDGSPYAAKELDKRKFMKNGVLDQKVENEMKIMQKAQHPNIVQYIEHFDWDDTQFIIIMEFVPGGDLGKFILDYGAIAEPHVKVISDQLIDALSYLHSNKITHRDVKPDNILIQSTHPLVVKLTDFGLSKMIDTEQTFLKTFCGTLLYCAPEVYNEFSSYDDYGRRTQRTHKKALDKERYDHAVDIWSLGGVLFYTLTASPPFPVKNGITYTALLDHIVKTPLDTSPLTQQGVSSNGVHFLTRMIHVRPETRATIGELQAHPWLSKGAESQDSAADEELGQTASQLSLEDKQSFRSQSLVAGASSLQEPEPEFSMNFESEKENHTFEQDVPNRLFGEVSATGSDSTIPEDRLNLPVSGNSFGGTEAETEILDSFEESDRSTPRANRQASQDMVALSQFPSHDNSRSAFLGIGSQSLGGASAILENLNMQSMANREATVSSSQIADLASSKRKPGYNTSDDFDDSPSSRTKPSFKRFKSQGDVGYASDEDDFALFASIPPMVKSQSGRQIAYPLHKSTFWDSSNKNTWHLDYPEMTNLQYNAFELAAERRKEEFSPGKSRLWDLAMKHFPPSHVQEEPYGMARQLELRPAGLRRDERVIRETPEWAIPSTASLPSEDDTDSLPDTLPPENSYPPALEEVHSLKTVVAMFQSAEGSLVPGISIALKDPVMSWGREPHNTVVYQPLTELKVPKNAFRVLLWREGYSAAWDDFRPWEPARSVLSRTTIRAPPEPDSYAFYISTKATQGIRVNNRPLASNEPKDNAAPCNYWMKLYHGDMITFWGQQDIRRQAKVTFECYWGGSSSYRPEYEPPACVPETQARKLDRLWPKAVTSLRHDRIKTEANKDQEARMRCVGQEQERSRLFELKRAEAVRMLASQGLYQTSPVSAPADFETDADDTE
ncbi:hypothetical protein F4780DRAFT_337207 [Xylariomycetidae sp. FL0641]|nr:hypothetical protein F4780DRAFT_337207 [Xylariomycetidae sp. FL0641]